MILDMVYVVHGSKYVAKTHYNIYGVNSMHVLGDISRNLCLANAIKN